MALEFYPSEGKQTTARIKRGNPPEMWSLNARLIEDADLIENRALQQIVIQEALKRDRGCIMTHSLLAKLADNPGDRIRHYIQAVHSGQELWDPVVKEMGTDLDCWAIPSIKPYVSALFFLGEALAETHDFKAAKRVYREVINLVFRRRDYDGLLYAENRQLLWSDAQLDAARDAGLLLDQSELVEGLDHLVN